PFCIIIDHVGNWKRHGAPDREVEWTLDRIIKRRDRVNLLRVCWNIQCNSPYDRTLTHCPWCGSEAAKIQRTGGENERVKPEMVDGDLMLLDPQTLAEMESAVKLEDP